MLAGQGQIATAADVGPVALVTGTIVAGMLKARGASRGDGRGRVC